MIVGYWMEDEPMYIDRVKRYFPLNVFMQCFSTILWFHKTPKMFLMLLYAISYVVLATRDLKLESTEFTASPDSTLATWTHICL